MSVLVEFQIATEQFNPGRVVARHDDLRAELERVVPMGNHVIPYVWATGPPKRLEAFTETLEGSEAIASVTALDRVDIDGSSVKQQLYRIEWVLDELDVIGGILAGDGVILEGESSDSFWHLRLRFPDHDHVAQFYQYLADHDITEFSIGSIYELETRAERSPQYELTSAQREALALAAERGYFDSPRRVTLAELGGELGISEQAVSQRIRRAVRTIVHAALDRPENHRVAGTY